MKKILKMMLYLSTSLNMCIPALADASSALTDKGYKLEQVLIMSRHNIRSPLSGKGSFADAQYFSSGMLPIANVEVERIKALNVKDPVFLPIPELNPTELKEGMEYANNLCIGKGPSEVGVELSQELRGKILIEKRLGPDGVTYAAINMVYASDKQIRDLEPLNIDNPPMIYPLEFDALKKNKDGLYRYDDLIALFRKTYQY